ncbi:leucine-rich repeat serine/threonine-protein kinase 1-like [Antedon mediterranea]|uniref:leucine-rich repeat serine/threonine-protein kinase 1-like n=1 Tax=Antedon mediterranea TaxID=105859 RepID=UPI003AF676E5
MPLQHTTSSRTISRHRAQSRRKKSIHRNFPGKLIHQAAIYSNYELLKDLIQGAQKKFINDKDSFGRTALHAVCAADLEERKASVKCVELLLQCGAEPNMSANERYQCFTPLHLAARDGKMETMKLLLDFGADIEIKDIEHCKPMDVANKNSRQQCVEFLNSIQDEREKLRKEVEPQILQACADGKLEDLKSLLKRVGLAAINKDYLEGVTPLFKACCNGHLVVVNYLIDRGASGRANESGCKWTPLYAACLYGFTEIADILLKYFPSMAGEITQDQQLPLHAAAAGGHTEIVKLLLYYDYSVIADKGKSRLHQTSSNLKAYKGGLPFHINLQNINGQTSLYLASAAGHVDIVKSLLEFQPNRRKHHSMPFTNSTRKKPFVDVNTYTVVGQTPLHAAVLSWNVEITSLLLKYGAEVNAPIQSLYCLFNNDNCEPKRVSPKFSEKVFFTKENSSLLFEACSAFDYKLEVITLLLKHGAKDTEGKALLSALLSRRDDIVRVMLGHSGVHPDSEFTVNSDCLAEFKAASCAVSVDQLATEPIEKRTGKSVKETSNQTPHYSKMAQQLSKDGGRSINRDRRRTVAIPKRLISNSASFDVPVAIDWHDMELIIIETDWLIEASLRYNITLQNYEVSPGIQHPCLSAITRIDISDNSLSELPLVIFQLPSLHVLSAAKNKISKLPIGKSKKETAKVEKSDKRHTVGSIPSASTKSQCENQEVIWNCPMLSHIDLNNNWLDKLPAVMFHLPVLETLNVHGNQLKQLPFDMWMAPKLKHLDLSKNKLEELPSNILDGLDDSQTFHSSTASHKDKKQSLEMSLDKNNLLKDRDEDGDSGMEEGDKFRMNHSETSSRAIKKGRTPTETSEQSTTSSNSEVFGNEKQKRKHTLVNVRRHQLWSTSSLGYDEVEEEPISADEVNCLEVLNLSKNFLSKIPIGLPCLAPKLSKLILSENKITDFGPINKFPAGLVDLEVSHNDIKSMSVSCRRAGSLSRKDSILKMLHVHPSSEKEKKISDILGIEPCCSPAIQTQQNAHLLAMNALGESRRDSKDGQVISSALLSPPAVSLQYCKHRRHRVLANLRTLDLTNNNITQLQVVSRTEEINVNDEKQLEDSDDHDQSCVSLCFPVEDKTEVLKDVPKIVTNHPSPSDDITLLFPDLAFLAVSNNKLTEIPKDIQYLTKLSNLRIDGNEMVTMLPPEMGRLQNLYDLKVDGCSLTEPLSSMTSNLLVKDVLGYLRCILDDAKPYARMKLMFVGKACIGKTTLLNELRKGNGPYGNQSPESFAERQGNTHIGGKTLKGNHLSTVGVDVCEWTYCKKNSKYGKVTFSTWDFGGQQEFYATHQYFLTKRSLYLVLWKLTDGEKGINELQQWLVNIQARAPNSPVILVGTHLDVLRSSPRYSRDYLMELTRKVTERFIDIAHPQDLGLPDVRAFVPINCLRSNHIAKLRNTIYDTAFSITGRDKRDREPLLKHPVPTSYLALEKAIAYLAAERREEKKEPVLTTTEYRTEVTHVMQMQSQVSFHDKEELMQATRFLHNNGVLLHYEDAMLADYYFLDPQWLCDTLAKVVTIPEINPCVKCGVMKIDDLKMKFQSSGVRHYILSLLNKFEVAVAFDTEHLLIPSLLPQEGEMICIPVNRDNINITKQLLQPLPPPVEITRPATKSLHLPSPKPAPEKDQTFFQTTTSSILALAQEVSSRFSSPAAPEDGGKRNGFKTLFPQNKRPRMTSPILVRRTADENSADQYQAVFSAQPIPETESPGFSLHAGENPYAVIRRLFFLQYIPSGFWSRVISRFLSDQILYSIIETLYSLPENADETFDEDIHKKWSSGLKWMCWQTGIELSLHGVPLFHVKEIIKESLLGCVFKKDRRPDTVQVLVSTIDGQDRSVSTSRLGQLEILIPNQILSVQKEVPLKTPSMAASSSGSSISSSGSNIELLPSLETASRLLAAIVDLLDVLLENFYPTLYEPLGQTFEGELLITRIVPCIHCWIDYNRSEVADVDDTEWEVVDWNPADLQQALHEEGVSPKPVRRTPKTEIQSILRQRCPKILYKSKKENTIGTISSPINGKLDLQVTNFDQSLKRTPNNVNLKKKSSKDSIATENYDSGIDAPELQGETPEVVVQNPTMEKSVRLSVKKKVGGLLLPEQSLQTNVDENQAKKRRSPKSTPSQTPTSLTPDKERKSLEFSACFRLGSFSDTEPQYKVYGFLFEELVLRGMKYEEVKCPNHGRILLKDIAPDVVYYDLGPGKLVDKSNLEVAKLLGIGSFGFVYKGHMIQEELMSEVPVAIKMLQPYPPGHAATNTIKQRYEMNDAKWHRDPLRHSCEAYHTARKELSIIMTLEHANIVPLLAFCRQPMCLILELAPHGSLDARLEDYKRVGARLTSPVIQQIIVQVSSAVDYLHQKGIIYRDLKAENVLVWNLPEPHLILPCEYVQVKLADYGISVSTLPSGTKGYGGTPGYMAPEIVQYEGKETYTEKVDCFSFGMFMYELMSMQRPFESQVGKNRGRLSEVIKQLIKDGERPILTRKEQSYPVYILDLMVWCWAQDPRERPSMQEVHQIASMPEFANLHEVLSLDEEIDVAAACSITAPSELSSTSEGGLLNVLDTDIWISHSNANVQILTYSEKCVQEENVNVTSSNASIVCMCYSSDSFTVWLSLSIGVLVVYSVSNNEQVARFRIPPTSDDDINHVATAMVHIALQQQMVVATDSGYVIVFDEGDGDIQPQEVFTYRYVGAPVTSLALAPNSFKCERVIELWCGNPGGTVSILNIGEFDLSMDVEIVKHFQEPLEVSSVDIMVAYDIQMAERLGLYYVWTYVHPGTSVYRWTVETRKMEEELDVAEILCNDGVTADGEDTIKRLSANQCQVSSMCLIKDHLYIGTVWGRLIIADSLSLSPITTVQCHRGPIKSILPIRFTQHPTSPDEEHDECDQSELDIFETPSKTSLVTIGKGFHNLIAGFPDCPSGVKVHDSNNAYYILTWNADSWEQLV